MDKQLDEKTQELVERAMRQGELQERQKIVDYLENRVAHYNQRAKDAGLSTNEVANIVQIEAMRIGIGMHTKD